MFFKKSTINPMDAIIFEAQLEKENKKEKLYDIPPVEEARKKYNDNIIEQTKQLIVTINSCISRDGYYRQNVKNERVRNAVVEFYQQEGYEIRYYEPEDKTDITIRLPDEE